MNATTFNVNSATHFSNAVTNTSSFSNQGTFSANGITTLTSNLLVSGSTILSNSLNVL